MVVNLENSTDRLHSRRARFTRAAINIGTGVATAFALKSSTPLPEMPSFLNEPAGHSQIYHGEHRNWTKSVQDQAPVSASRPTVASEFRPSPVAESPIPIIGLSILAGIPVGGAVVGAIKDRGSRGRGAFRGSMGGLMIDGVLACALTTPTPIPTPEIRPAEVLQFQAVSGEQVRSSMQVWVDANKPFPDGNIIQDVDLDGKIFAPYFDPPAEVISADMRSVGWVRLGQMETSQNGTLQYQPLLIWNDGTSTRALATGSASAVDSATVRANLIDAAGNIIGYQETGTDLTHPFIRLQIKNPNSSTGELVSYTLKSQNQDQIQQYLTLAKFTSGSIEVNVTPTAAVIPTVEASPIPQKPLSVDAAKSFAEWDMTGFTSEQQGWLKVAVEDPWHAPMEAKNFFDLVRSQGIADQTGDQSYAAVLPEDSAARAQEANRRVGNYVEWMFAHGIREASSPIPFAWRQANLGDRSNYPIINTSANPGYLVEGYEWYRNNPEPYSLKWFTSRTGIGLADGMTQEMRDIDLEYQLTKGQNDKRDTIFGEPFFIVGPTRATSLQGDVLAMIPIAGTPIETAQEAVIRMYDVNGAPKYTFIRIQYADQTIGQEETSCMSIPLGISAACPVGTVLKPAHMSQWDDARRETNISASRAKMLELLNMQVFAHPPRIFLQGNVWTSTPGNIFMDAAPTIDDIKIPTVPPEFFK